MAETILRTYGKIVENDRSRPTMKNQCDVTGNQPTCTLNDMTCKYHRVSVFSEHIGCAFEDIDTCSNMDAIRDAIEAERMETIANKIASIRAEKEKADEK